MSQDNLEEKTPEEVWAEMRKRRDEASIEGHNFAIIFLGIFLVMNFILYGKIDEQSVSVIIASEAGMAYHNYKRDKNKLDLSIFISGIIVAISIAAFKFIF